MKCNWLYLWQNVKKDVQCCGTCITWATLLWMFSLSGILFFCFRNGGHPFDCDINTSWNAGWWAKLGATGFSGFPSWVGELLEGWEALWVNRSKHGNSDLVRSSEGRGQGCSCCICKGRTKVKEGRKLGGFGEQTGAGKEQWRYPKAPLMWF